MYKSGFLWFQNHYLFCSKEEFCRNNITLFHVLFFFPHLQTLIMGNRDDIDQMSGSNGMVLTTALKLIDKYDLYGQVAYPKHHKQFDVPEIYRLAAKTKVCFICVETKNSTLFL